MKQNLLHNELEMDSKQDCHPTISVVMPLYNKAEQVLDSISSVCAQSFQNWELVVVDDGSTDESALIVRSVQESRIRIIRQENAGVSAARNSGIKNARASVVAFLDADDTWEPGFLQAISDLRNGFPEAKVYATSFRYSYGNGGVFKSRLVGCDGFHRGLLAPYFQVAAKSDPPICSSAVAVDRTALFQIGGFPEGMTSGEDLLTWARLAVRFPIAYDASPLATYEVSEITRDADPENRVGKELEILRVAYPTVAGLRNYIGYWHYIQSSLAFASGQRTVAISLALRSLFFNPLDARSWYCAVRSLLPRALVSWLVQQRRSRRS